MRNFKTYFQSKSCKTFGKSLTGEISGKIYGKISEENFWEMVEIISGRIYENICWRIYEEIFGKIVNARPKKNICKISGGICEDSMEESMEKFLKQILIRSFERIHEWLEICDGISVEISDEIFRRFADKPPGEISKWDPWWKF